jgi:cob(I)alamin adenosyltransferase
VEAYGSVDELIAALGSARAAAPLPFLQERLLAIQKDLVVVMGELATQPGDLARYVKDNFPVVTPELTVKLDRIVQEIEAQNVPFKGWSTPGNNAVSAALDVARATGRRAERRVCALQESGQPGNVEILVYLNRLSDALWLMARWAEARG